MARCVLVPAAAVGGGCDARDTTAYGVGVVVAAAAAATGDAIDLLSCRRAKRVPAARGADGARPTGRWLRNPVGGVPCTHVSRYTYTRRVYIGNTDVLSVFSFGFFFILLALVRHMRIA